MLNNYPDRIVTACIIAKNEHKYIENCINALSEMGLPVIVCDTGSDDDTVDIALKCGAKVVSFEWQDDFSAAKNYCASQADTDWVWSVDADEIICPDEAKISLLLNNLKALNKEAGIIPPVFRIVIKNIINEEENRTERLTRIFNRNFFGFEGKVHEQIVPFRNVHNADFDYKVIDTGICFKHFGYASEKIETKALRNKTLLKKLIKEDNKQSTNPYICYQLGKCEYNLKNFEEATACYEKALANLTFNENAVGGYVLDLIDAYGYALLESEGAKGALAIEKYYDACCIRADYFFLLGYIYMKNALFDNAVLAFKTAISVDNYAQEGVNSYLAYYNIGVIYEVLGQYEEAEKAYSLCGDYAKAAERLSAISGKCKQR